MSANQMQRQSRSQLNVAFMKPDPLSKHPTNEVLDVAYIEGVAVGPRGHVAPGSKGHLCLLNVKNGIRELLDAASMVVMKVRHDDIGNSFGINAN